MTGINLAHRFAAAMSEACERLGVGQATDVVADRVRAFVGEPLDMFDRYVNWPAALNLSGPPVEMSVKLEPGRASVRCVTDPTNYLLDPVGNWHRYLALAVACVASRTPEQETVVRDLCRAHLDGVPSLFPSRVVHGLGYSGTGEPRGSLYFRTGWMAGPRLAERLPDLVALGQDLNERYACPPSEQIEVVGYDFVGGELTKAKTYSWWPVRPGRPFEELAGTHPALRSAGLIFARHAHAVPAHLRELCVFIQSSRSGDALRQRMFFFPDMWGWASPAGERGLFRQLADECGVDLDPLAGFREALAEHDLPMRLSLVSIADAAVGPSVTFYFLPTNGGAGPRRPAAGSADTADPATRLYGTGVAALLACRSPDGSWPDPASPSEATTRPGHTFTTAYVAAALAGDAVLHKDLAMTADWLAKRHVPGAGWGPDDSPADPETTALALLALARLRRPFPEGWSDPAAPAGPRPDAEVAAVVSLALSVTSTVDGRSGAAGVLEAVLDSQCADGGWPATAWAHRLVATGRALDALRAAGGHGPALRSGLQHVEASVVVPDPLPAALWLGAWLAGGGHLYNATIGRVVELLDSSRCAGGGWPPSPARRLVAAPDEAGAGARDDGPEGWAIDAWGTVTTATVVDALRRLLTARRRLPGSA